MGILIDQHTAILVQGITGREASHMVRESLAYGARIVAGITPGKGGLKVEGLPVYDCVRNAVQQHGVNATVISVPPFAVLEAALEAIENRIKLLVIVTERVPRRDVAEILSFASEQGATVIGPNSLGVISPGVTKVGSIGGSAENTNRSFTPGGVGVISRSGGMTCEIGNLLTQNGIGQSTCVSVGGDPLIGSNFTELFRLYQDDPETKAVVLLGEPGGGMEEEFAEFYAAQRRPKPVAAFIAGKFVEQMPGTRFGHAAVIVQEGRGGAGSKMEVLRKAGVYVADELSHLPNIVREVLGNGHVH